MLYEIPLVEDFNIKVGAHTIYVRFVSAEDDLLGENASGVWVPRKYTILLDQNAPYSIRLSTLLHELIHVFEEFYTVKVSHKDLNIIGDAYTQVLMDNFRVETPETQEEKAGANGTHEEE